MVTFCEVAINLRDSSGYFTELMVPFERSCSHIYRWMRLLSEVFAVTLAEETVTYGGGFGYFSSMLQVIFAEVTVTFRKSCGCFSWKFR